MVEILYFGKELAGYDIYKIYVQLFPKVTLRSIYYHLKKGTSLGEFKISEIKKNEGDYSWGSTAEKIYYTLGDKANPTMKKRVKDYFFNH